MIKPSPFAISIAAIIVTAVPGPTLPRADRACATPFTVIAGSNDVGDGGRATDAVLAGIGAIAVDRQSNLYISDIGHNRIRRVDGRSRIIGTVAGSGEIYRGDADPRATAQAFMTPGPVALDPLGRFLYSAEIVTSKVRRTDLRTGRAEDLGEPPGGFGQDIFGQPIALLPQASDVVVVDPVTGRVWRYADSRWIALPSQASAFSGGLRSAVMDRAGNLLLSEFFAHRILRLDHESGKVTTIVGTGEAGRSEAGAVANQARIRSPDGLAIDGQDNLYFSDTGNRRICKVSLQDNRLVTVHELGGDPTGIAWTPGPIVYDAHGDLWVSDIAASRVLRFRAGSKVPEIIAGGGPIGDGGPAVRARVGHPNHLATDAHGNLYFADAMFHRVRVVEAATGVIRTVAGTGVPGFSGDGGPAVRAQVSYPSGLYVTQDEKLYIADYYNHRVRSVDLRNGIMTTIAGTGKAGSEGDGGPAIQAALLNPHALSLDDRNNLLVTSAVSASIRAISLSTGTIDSVQLDPRLVPPGKTIIFSGIAAVKGGFYVADVLRNTIFSYQAGRLSAVVTGKGLYYPNDLTVSPQGELYICDTRNNRIVKWADGRLQVVIDGLGRPRGVLADARGDLYVTETFHNRVIKVCLGGPARETHGVAP
jgi:sugar lactone lactonase YvrE